MAGLAYNLVENASYSITVLVLIKVCFSYIQRREKKAHTCKDCLQDLPSHCFGFFLALDNLAVLSSPTASCSNSLCHVRGIARALPGRKTNLVGWRIVPESRLDSGVWVVKGGDPPRFLYYPF